jgi:hypothetical protein
MPVIEMRESLGDQDVEIVNDQDRVKVVQKRINLKEGSYQRNMLQMDLFFDDFPNVLGRSNPQRFQGWIEFFLSPTPLILSIETLQLTPRRGPNASNPNVLYKAVIGSNVLDDTFGVPNIQPQITKFPQDFLATNANFPFFHDQLYLTMVFHMYDDPTFSSYPTNIRFSCSLYMSYHEKRVSSTRACMGVIAERFEMMMAESKTAGRVLQNPLNLAGDTIPSWQWGGIRPELMVSGQSLSQYWLKKDGQSPEPMQTSASLRQFAKEARQMVANPDAFGTVGTAQGDVPDWFSSFLPKGIEAGPVRPQFPPRVTQDNPGIPGLGNILMV